MARTSRPEIKSLETTFRIIETLNDLGNENVTGLESKLGIPNSTIFEHIKTLERFGYVIREDGQYRLSMKFLELGGGTRDRISFYQTAKPELKKLTEETGERVNLVVEEGADAVFIEILRGEEAVNQDISVGSRTELYCTAAGKAILAFQPEERIEEYLANTRLLVKTPNTITDPNELREELAEVRREGFALDLAERHRGLHCVAAPIKDDTEVPVGSISISGPSSRLSEDRLRNELAGSVVQTANVVELNSIFT